MSFEMKSYDYSTAVYVYNWYLAYFSKAGAIGLMANELAESGYRSNNLQNSHAKKWNITDEEYTAQVDAGMRPDFATDTAGYGLCQWTYRTRKQGLLDYAKSEGTSIADLDMQLRFSIIELKAKKSLYTLLQTSDDPELCAVEVMLKYERPGDQSEENQQRRAFYASELWKVLIKEDKVMSNSSLVDCTNLSPNHSGKRTHKIDRITPHCVVGQVSAERIGEIFATKNRKASCNYGIGYDGRVCLVVDEANRSWCSSSNANDQRAITIEIASETMHPYAMNEVAFDKLVALCVDICKRNDLTKLLWFADKNKSLSYEPKDGECVLTVHRWFANKACPGDWLYNRLGELASKVNAILTPIIDATDKLYRVQVGAFGKLSNAERQLKAIEALGYDAFIVLYGGYYRVQVGAYHEKSNAENMLSEIKSKGFSAIIITTSGTAIGTEEFKPYLVKVNADVLNVRSGAGTDHRIVTTVKRNTIYTIVDESNGWGKLKSGAGWICLKYTAKCD